MLCSIAAVEFFFNLEANLPFFSGIFKALWIDSLINKTFGERWEDFQMKELCLVKIAYEFQKC